MRIKFYFALSILLFGVKSQMFCQSYTPKLDLRNVSPSPNVTDILNLRSPEVNNYTGTINYNIPIISISQGDLFHKIDLNYSYSGLNPLINPSWVGLGWTLNSHGVITRIIRDNEDSESLLSFDDPNFFETVNNDLEACKNSSTANDIYDHEPDMFSFSFNGYSGSFYFYNGVAKMLSPNDVKVLKFGSDSSLRFELLTPDGRRGIFDVPEKTTAIGFRNSSSYISSWHISKMISPSNLDTLRFEYEDEIYIDLNSGAVDYFNFTVRNYYSDVSFANESLNANNLVQYSTSSNWGYQIHQSKRLSRIRNKLGYLDFQVQNEFRLDQDSLPNRRSENRALSSVSLKLNNGQVVEKVKFDTEYFSYNSNDPSTFRLKLKSFYWVDSLNNKFKNYNFEYYNESSFFPKRNTKSIDNWGFYNGANNQSLFPKSVVAFWFQREISSLGSESDRRPKLNYASYGALKRIDFPTGGNNQIVYDEHKLSQYYNLNEFIQTNIVSQQVFYEEDQINNIEVRQLIINNPQKVKIDFQTFYNDCLNENRINYTQSSVLIKNIFGSVVYNSGRPINCEANSVQVFLEPGQYTIEFSCPFNASSMQGSVSYYIVDTSKCFTGPGIRVKEIIGNETNTLISTKKIYKYEDSLGVSSSDLFDYGILGFNYGVFYTTIDDDQFCYHTTFRIFSTKPSVLQRFGKEKHYYRSVKEIDLNVNTNEVFSVQEFQYDKLVAGLAIDQNISDIVKLVSRKVYQVGAGNQLTLVSLEEFKYLNLIGQSPFFRIFDSYGSVSDNPCLIFVGETENMCRLSGYSLAQVKILPSEIISKYFSLDGSSLTWKENYFYNDLYQLKKKVVSNSKQSSKVYFYNYTTDFNLPVFLSMVHKNIVEPIIEEQCWVSDSLGNPIYLFGAKIVDYSDVVFKPLHEWFLSSADKITTLNIRQFSFNGNYSSFLSDNRYEKRTSLKYSSNGRLIQVDFANGLTRSYFYGYGDELMVAFVDGLDYNQVLSSSNIDLEVLSEMTSNNNTSKINELNKLNSIPNIVFKARVYKPFVGIQVEFSNNDLFNYYYDSFNRLSSIKDENNRFIKRFCYQLNNDSQINCSGDSVLPNNPNTCDGIDKKVINGICESGLKICTSSTRLTSNLWRNSFYYRWSDNSTSQTFTIDEPYRCINTIIIDP